MSIKIYVEGGGKSNKLRTECRQGFRLFFENADLAGRMPAVVACGSRNDAFDSFRTAMKRPKANTLPLLLVDSESGISDSPWMHLKNRDGWDRPVDATDDHVYLMAQCMEAWFLADRDCLMAYFGQRFLENSLPNDNAVETIPKQKVFDALKMASRGSNPKGEYGKGKHSFDLLGKIAPKKVRGAAPNADRLLKKLEDS